MPLNLRSVQGYVQDIRSLLLDKTKPYRYTDTAIIVGLNLALDEGYRLRPDLFIHRGRTHVPSYEEPSGEIVPIERQFRQAFVYGVAAYVLLKDEEDVQDARSNVFLARFQSMLLGVRQVPMPPNAGTPTPAGGGKTPSPMPGGSV